MSKLKIRNGSTWEEIPAGGVGVPSGGTAGQILMKSSSTDYADEWADISEAGAMSKWTLLWTNASPTSNFAAQTVALDLSGYSAVIIAINRASSELNAQWFFAPTSNGVIFAEIAWLGNYVTPLSQRVMTVTTSGVKIQNCTQKANLNNTTAPATHNQDLIPYQIYGIKGVVS